jgi:hypothetical protein
LWVACGGICSFKGCNKRLIKSSNGELTNVGIKAHIIGHAKSSARHEYMDEYGYTQDSLEDVSNLMIMCYYHSKYIDDKSSRHLFPPSLLFEMKSDHEKMVASWSEEKNKKSIAIIHKMLGGPLFEIEHNGDAPYILLDAVEDQTEFIDYTPSGWEEGKKRNTALYEMFIEKLKEQEANVAEVFPLSPIPLLIHFGTLLTDTVHYCIYQYDREAGFWVYDNPLAKREVNLYHSFNSKGNNELAVSVSLSGKVKTSMLEETLKSDFDTLAFEIDNPSVKSVLYKQDVMFIQSTIKHEIERLLQEFDYKKIHLFYAGPAGLAIEIGRGINSNIWCEVCLYQFSIRQTPKYQYALSI